MSDGKDVRIRHYFPGRGRSIELCLATHSGCLTPPRISRSCPHWLSLWLGRGTIVGKIRLLRNSLPRLLWAECSSLAAGWGFTSFPSGSWRTCRIAFLLIGLSADVIQSPDMTIHKMVFVNVLWAEEKVLSLYTCNTAPSKRSPFQKFFYFLFKMTSISTCCTLRYSIPICKHHCTDFCTVLHVDVKHIDRPRFPLA